MPTSINSSPKSTNFNIRMGRRKKMSNTKLTHSTDKEGKNQNLWPDLPQQLIGLIARNSSMMKDVYSKGVTKSWRSAESRKCRPISLTPLWLELSADYGDDHGRSHTFNIPFKVGYIWYWTRNRQRPNLIGDYHFLGFSRGLLVAKAAKDSANYTLLDPHPYRGGWNMPLWDADVPFLSASLSAFPLTSPRTRTQAKAKSIVMVLTGISNPAFLYYRVWEDKTWVKKASTMVDPHCCDPNEQDHLLRFGNGIWLKGKFYALSLAGTVAVIEDIGDDVRVTAIVITPASSLSFNFTTFDPDNHSIKYEGQATPLLGSIQLTENLHDITGHASYSEPFHLWDKASGNLSSFVANFTYSIDAQNNVSHSDGIAFFIANMGYRIPEVQQGSGIGLASGNQTLNSTANPFVAVEFDTYHNAWDEEEGDHVGIDISSLKSSKSLKWYSVLDGRILDASIAYDSGSKNLCAYFTGIPEGFPVQQKLCYEIDLRDYLPEWVWIGFSAATGMYSEFHNIHSWSFDSYFPSTLSPSSSPPYPSPPSNTPNDIKFKTLMIAGWSVAGLILLASIVTYFCRKQKENIPAETDKGKPEEPEAAQSSVVQDYEFDKVSGAKKIPYDVLVRATNGFSVKQKLGEGGFGAVFRGVSTELDRDIAVKRISESSTQGIQEYAAEVIILSQLRHRNLVELVGWCHEKEDILLVYEFLPKRSLDFHLYDGENLLDWKQRYKIIQGIASGLHYLHHEWKQRVLHRDIKPSNVLLDSEFNPMLGDFGLARIIDHNVRSQTFIGGSLGYIAPECFQTQKTTKESDIFSFGVVALELACGRKTCVKKADGQQIHIVEWLWKYFYESGRILEAADRKLNGDYNEEEMEKLLMVGLWCGHPDPSWRPSMEEVVYYLRVNPNLPDLPLQYPKTDQQLPSISSSNETFITAASGRNTAH